MNSEPADILLVEDNAYDAELTLNALKSNAVNSIIHHVWDGAEALDYFFDMVTFIEKPLTALPKVILLDLKLPKVDGLEFLTLLKQSERFKVIPVVVLTSSNEEPDMKKSYDLGANSYIVKPVEFTSFHTVVVELGLYWTLHNESFR